MLEACPIERSDARVVGYGANEEGWAATANSDVVVITSGVPRKPGMSRDDLLRTNADIVRSVTKECVRYSQNAIIIVGGKTRRRRKMSAKARAAISKAQKARWAKQKAGEK